MTRELKPIDKQHFFLLARSLFEVITNTILIHSIDIEKKKHREKEKSIRKNYTVLPIK